jgi:hypothetical protein
MHLPEPASGMTVAKEIATDENMEAVACYLVERTNDWL